jgi:hypothetical protein
MTIKLEINAAQMGQEISEWMGGVEELTKPSVLTDLSKAIFSITGKRFMVDVDNYARLNPKKMHHVYEWGKIGQSNGRLFVIERSKILYGDLVVGVKFLSSKMPVPVNPKLLKPGRTGKSVTRKSIFANKAQVMESGTPVSFEAKRVLAFMGNEGIAFIAPGTKINILHPGGIQTKNAFATYLLEWYTKNAHLVLESSGFYETLASDVARALNSESSTSNSVALVKTAVSNLANKIDVGATIK